MHAGVVYVTGVGSTHNFSFLFPFPEPCRSKRARGYGSLRHPVYKDPFDFQLYSRACFIVITIFKYCGHCAAPRDYLSYEHVEFSLCQLFT